MASENVKVRILELDKTTPVLAGTDSTDIAFVPGFSVSPGATTIPKLVTSVAEFEQEFGPAPREFTEEEADYYNQYGFVKGFKDTGYIMAKELLREGMSVVYANLTDTSNVCPLDAIYLENNALSAALKAIADKGVYSVKYITSGGYPTVVKKFDEETGEEMPKEADASIGQQLIDCAATRGDAVALLDYQLDCTESAYGSDESFYARVNLSLEGLNSPEFGTMMYPWAQYTVADGVADLPASFAYLMCVARAIKRGPNWLAMAGVARGQVPNIRKCLTPGDVLTNTAAEEMQPKFGAENQRLISVNCITNIRPYGLTLWGNRTLKPLERNKGTVALNFLHTRNMISDIKKLLYTTAKELMFEQDTQDLWRRFKAGIRPLLEKLKNGSGISDYQIVRGTTRYNGEPLTRGEVAAIIKIYPVDAVEYFELAVEINDQDVTLS